MADRSGPNSSKRRRRRKGVLPGVSIIDRRRATTAPANPMLAPAVCAFYRDSGPVSRNRKGGRDKHTVFISPWLLAQPPQQRRQMPLPRAHIGSERVE
jgi:hypothetical protein